MNTNKYYPTYTNMQKIWSALGYLQKNGGGGGGGTDASALTTGTLNDARLSSNVVLLNSAQTLTNKSISAEQINSGTLADARLSTNVALKSYVDSIVAEDFQYLADYVINKSGSTYTAYPKKGSGLTKYSGTVPNVVIQNAINAITPAGAVGSGGGLIIIGKMIANLSDEIVINGWENNGSDPQSQLSIIGSGYSTQLIQNTAGKNVFVYKNRVCPALSNIRLGCGATALSAIYLAKNGANSEISVARGSFDNIRIDSVSTSAPAFRGINFFGINVNKMDIYQTTYTNMSLENDSTAINYGNSNFNMVNLIAPENNAFAGLSITSNNNHPMNLNHFTALYIGGQYYGQPAGRCIYIKGGSHNTFSHVDLEYVPFNIVIDGTSGSIESTSNIFKSGYLFTSDGGTAIQCAQSANGNKFELELEGDNANIQIITDLQEFRPANEYNLYIGVSLAPATKIAITSPTETLVKYKQNGVGLTYTGNVKRLSASDTTGDIYYRSAGQVEQRLPIGTVNHVLTVVGGIPQWRVATAAILTGYTSGAGTISAADTILTAINKLNGNDLLKAPLASPSLTGTPLAPTATAGTNTTQIATTAFVQSAITAPVVDIVNTTVVNAVSGTKYYANHAGLSTLLLPTTAVKGSQILMRGQGAGGWRITQNANQKIHGASDSTTGTGGSLASQTQYDTVVLECMVANLEWIIVANRGTLTIV